MLGEWLPSFPTQAKGCSPKRSPYFLLWNLSPLLWSSLQDPMVYMNDKSPLVSYQERPLKATALSTQDPFSMPVSAP